MIDQILPFVVTSFSQLGTEKFDEVMELLNSGVLVDDERISAGSEEVVLLDTFWFVPYIRWSELENVVFLFKLLVFLEQGF